MKDVDINNTTSFHIQLLSRTIDMTKYPMIKLIIENNITEQEYRELFHLLQVLNKQYEIQKEGGLLDFTRLLIHFAGMLSSKLDPNETIYALKKEGYYPSLMGSFIRLIEEEKPGTYYPRLTDR